MMAAKRLRWCRMQRAPLRILIAVMLSPLSLFQGTDVSTARSPLNVVYPRDEESRELFPTGAPDESFLP